MAYSSSERPRRVPIPDAESALKEVVAENRILDAQDGLRAWELEVSTAQHVEETAKQEVRHAEELEARDAAHGVDPLTGVKRREVLERELGNQLKMIRGETASQRKGNMVPKRLSLLFVDLDHFKQVNDTHGHAAGDIVLKRAAAIMQHSLHRGKDMLSRHGGDEFAVLLPDTEEAGARAVAENIRQALIQDEILQKFGVTASIGVCSSEVSTAKEPVNFFNDADRAVYAAKHAGRNCVAVYSEP